MLTKRRAVDFCRVATAICPAWRRSAARPGSPHVRRPARLSRNPRQRLPLPHPAPARRAPDRHGRHGRAIALGPGNSRRVRYEHSTHGRQTAIASRPPGLLHSQPGSARARA